MPSTTEAARIRHAIARDQRQRWWDLWWQPAPTKRESDRRERLWFRWRVISFQSELATRSARTQEEHSLGNER